MKHQLTRLPTSGKAWWIGMVGIFLLVVPADARSGITTAHLFARVRASLPKKTAVPVRLPRWIPSWMPSSANFDLTAVMDAHRDLYVVTIEKAGCETGLNCQDVFIYGERLKRNSPRFLKLQGIKVRLKKGLIGYYSAAADTPVGTMSSFAQLEVDQNGFRYSFLAKEVTKAEIVHIARSAFDLSARKASSDTKPVAQRPASMREMRGRSALCFAIQFDFPQDPNGTSVV